MASKVRRGGRSKGKIKLTLASKLIQKNDKTRVLKRKSVPKAPAQMYRDNAANFKIKLRKK